MLSVSGLQAALKRRNSKVHRENVTPQSSLGLGAALRRFSSSEVLSSHLQSPPPAPSVATVSRKSSFSRRIRKVSTGNIQGDSVDGCTILDMHIAQIKRKLADFREEDVEISERVEELTNSLSGLCQGYHIPVNSVEPYLDYDPTADDTTQYDTSDQIQYDITMTPANQIHLDSNSQGDSADDEDFQKFCLNHPHLVKSSSCHLGYSTLPLPPPPTRYSSRERGDKRINRSASSTGSPARSHSYEHSHYATQFRLLAPRNSYPQEDNQSQPVTYQERVYRFKTPSTGNNRPVSYQEISYEETDYEEHMPEETTWTELSCP